MNQTLTPLSTEEFRALLKKKGLRATSQRIAVHEAICELGHASADMVCEHLSSRGENITVASVYNTLSQLSAIGVYRQRLSASSKMFFDVNAARHMHLYDTVRNEWRDLMDEELMDIIESRLKKKRFKGYAVDGIDIQILCHPTSSHRKI